MNGTATATPIAAMSSTREPGPFPAVATHGAGFASPETLTDGALAKVPETATAGGGLTVDQVREAVVAALATGGHASAAQLLGSGEWKLDSAGVHVVVPGMGKKMLSLTVNAEAEKIFRKELQRLGAPPKFVIVPGAGSAPAAASAPVVLAGSVQEAALAHPLVKRAQEIFNAEVRSVVDLRHK